jgi:phosphoenolpyruvate synthase/pyruvate phosphate dikinase
MAVDMVRQKLITERAALMRIDPEQLAFFLHDMIDPDAGMHSNLTIVHQQRPRYFVYIVKPLALCSGLPASPGCATGKIVFNCKEAEVMRQAGEKVILCREETSADDIGGLYAGSLITQNPRACTLSFPPLVNSCGSTYSARRNDLSCSCGSTWGKIHKIIGVLE